MEMMIGGAVVGAGVVLIGSSVVSGVGSVFRPLAKELIKGGIVVYKAVGGLIAETGEQMKDLVAEAEAELSESGTADAAKSDGDGKAE